LCSLGRSHHYSVGIPRFTYHSPHEIKTSEIFELLRFLTGLFILLSPFGRVQETFKIYYNKRKIGNSGFLENPMTTLQIRGKGTITLPASLRKKYNLEEGEVLTVIDLGEGTILLKPMMSQVNKLSRQIEKRLKEENISLDDLLQALDEERKTYYKKQYAKK